MYTYRSVDVTMHIVYSIILGFLLGYLILLLKLYKYSLQKHCSVLFYILFVNPFPLLVLDFFIY